MSNDNEKKKSFRDYPDYRENPFLKGLNEGLSTKYKKDVIATKKGSHIIDKDGTVEEDALFISRTKTVDADQFVKIFGKGIAEWFNLSTPASRVFMYIISIAKYDDKVIFDMSDCKEHSGYSSKSVIYRALAELVEAKFIAKTQNSSVFFINPEIFYKGDRLVLIKQFVKGTSKTKTTQEAEAKTLEVEAMKEKN